ncbi:MAG: hypothetical protein ASARMPRED_001978 [Alectoria sarmentosa]|nr:MAG: hypothetical protein ASARMPRED_001978 [Alectoria sarmentosa]
MAKRKSNLLTDPATATNASKKTKQGIETEDSGGLTRRNARSKNFAAPNATASARGTQSARAQGKKVSRATITMDHKIHMEDQIDSHHERVVFIDNNTGEPVHALYRKTEKAEPMAHLWAEFVRATQSVRDNIGADVLCSPLSEQEASAISLRNNAHIFPILITSKGGLRSKDNLEASTKNAQRNAGGTFTRGSATASQADILRSRASSLRKKANALQKQADAYDQVVDAMENQGLTVSEEEPLTKCGMAYIGEVLTLSRKEVNRYIVDHEEHLTATAEKLRSEMAGLAAYVHRAEKRLRDLIQTKIAADLRLLRDIKKFGSFEVQAWQMGALPHGSHVCWCDICTGTPRTADEDVDPDPDAASRVALQYPAGAGLPQARRENAYPEIKLEPVDDENLYSATPRRANTPILVAATDDAALTEINNAVSMDTSMDTATAISDAVDFVQDTAAPSRDPLDLEAEIDVTLTAHEPFILVLNSSATAPGENKATNAAPNSSATAPGENKATNAAPNTSASATAPKKDPRPKITATRRRADMRKANADYIARIGAELEEGGAIPTDQSSSDEGLYDEPTTDDDDDEDDDDEDEN